jgi:hypothetical protein
VSFLLLATVCAFAAAAAGVAVERRRGKEASGPDEVPPPPDAKAVDPFADDGLPFGLGDVVSAQGTERWLAGALELRDGPHLVAVLFLAPEGEGHAAVCAFSSPRRDIFWLAPQTAEVGAEPPSAIELGGIVMQRRARVPGVVRRHGQGAPEVGDQATFAEYTSGTRDVAVVLRGPLGALAWSGQRVDPDAYDRMGRGER